MIKPHAYKAKRIDTNEEVYGDYVIKDPIFGYKLATTQTEYRVHADSIMEFVGEHGENNYVYRSLIKRTS